MPRCNLFVAANLLDSFGSVESNTVDGNTSKSQSFDMECILEDKSSTTMKNISGIQHRYTSVPLERLFIGLYICCHGSHQKRSSMHDNSFNEK